ncbi:cuticle protein 16.8-like [Stegodyphus dumicola]|uniref:cuticle protein 16.8-like n=1 Tax=Stegodyphus dumicola TaxID=202533 RepID=UPI0015AFE179|nr:cuticle protein 16.8-like [Stegodyphus dumicola]
MYDDSQFTMFRVENIVFVYLTICIFNIDSVSVPAESILVVPVVEESVILKEATGPYAFGYQLKDGFDVYQHRQEESDGKGVIKGSYGYKDANGVYRIVKYTADINGYRAIVISNEPGLNGQNSADATFVVETPPPSVTVTSVPVLKKTTLR